MINGKVIAIDVPYKVTNHVVDLFVKVMDKTALTAGTDMNSHEDVYLLLRLALDYLPIDNINYAFVNFTKGPSYPHMQAPEYMFLIYNLYEEAVDYKQYFREHNTPFNMLRKCRSIMTSVEYISCLTFYHDYNLSLIFNENNPDIQIKVKNLEAERKATNMFLINPYMLSDYFKYEISTYPVWNCDTVSVVPKSEIGELTIADYMTLRDRFKEFACGKIDPFAATAMTPVLRTPRRRRDPATYKGDETHQYEIDDGSIDDNDLLTTNVKLPLAAATFPFKQVLFAGGSVGKCLTLHTGKSRQSDIDMFIFGPTAHSRSDTLNKIIQWFVDTNPPNTVYFALNNSVTTVYIKNVLRKFQIISAEALSPYDILIRFDLSHIQLGIVNGEVVCTPHACNALRTLTAAPMNLNKVRVNRLVKALYNGYSILKTPELLEFIDITDMISGVDNTYVGQLQKIIREFHKFYYPVVGNEHVGMTDKEFNDHAMAMIESDATANMVSMDPKFVMNNITIGGNFDNDYENLSFVLFNANNIAPKIMGRRNTRALVRNTTNIMRVTSGIMRVNHVIANDPGMEIRFDVDDSFEAFCNVLETTVFRLYRNATVSKHLISEEATSKRKILIVMMPKYKLDTQVRRGISCMKNQRGVSLNIEEELKVDDNVQMLFMIEIIVQNDIRAVELKPVKFIKYETDNDTGPQVNISDIIAEDMNNEITYEDI